MKCDQTNVKKARAGVVKAAAAAAAAAAQQQHSGSSSTLAAASTSSRQRILADCSPCSQIHRPSCGLVAGGGSARLLAGARDCIDN